jgi:uncharacterized protein YaaN involved in tellurite resistance
MTEQNQKLAVANTETLKQELGLVDPATGAAKENNNSSELDAKANQFVEALLKLDPEAIENRNTGKDAVENMGLEAQKKAVKQSSILQRPIKDLSRRAEDGGDVANALVNLKMEVESLDPAKFDFEAGWVSRTLGLIPGVGTPLKRYFTKYESAQTVIAAIIASLEKGRDQLGRDNITLIEDQKMMHETTIKLQQTIKLVQLIDQKLQYKLDRELEPGSEKHKFVAEELLFPLRQRTLDLQQQLAVSQQGVLAVEIIIRNNKELMRGVSRSLNVTVNALQVATTVALALESQKVVLDKIELVNKTTSDLIANTAARLKTQGTQIQKQASGAQLDMDSLKLAFQDIQTAMNDISQFRMNALPEMAKTVLELDQLTAESQKAVERLEQAKKVKPEFEIE